MKTPEDLAQTYLQHRKRALHMLEEGQIDLKMYNDLIAENLELERTGVRKDDVSFIRYKELQRLAPFLKYPTFSIDYIGRNYTLIMIAGIRYKIVGDNVTSLGVSGDIRDKKFTERAMA